MLIKMLGVKGLMASLILNSELAMYMRETRIVRTKFYKSLRLLLSEHCTLSS